MCCVGIWEQRLEGFLLFRWHGGAASVRPSWHSQAGFHWLHAGRQADHEEVTACWSAYCTSELLILFVSGLQLCPQQPEEGFSGAGWEVPSHHFQWLWHGQGRSHGEEQICSFLCIFVRLIHQRSLEWRGNADLKWDCFCWAFPKHSCPSVLSSDVRKLE